MYVLDLMMPGNLKIDSYYLGIERLIDYLYIIYSLEWRVDLFPNLILQNHNFLDLKH